MQKIAIILFLSTITLTSELQVQLPTSPKRDTVDCTKSLKKLTNDVFDIARQYKENSGETKIESFHILISTIGLVSEKCFNK